MNYVFTIRNTCGSKLLLLCRLSLILRYFFMPVVIFSMSSNMVYGDRAGLKMLFLQRVFAPASSGLQGAPLTCSYFSLVRWVFSLGEVQIWTSDTHGNSPLARNSQERLFMYIIGGFSTQRQQIGADFFIGPLHLHESLKPEVQTAGGCTQGSSELYANTHSGLDWLFIFV